MNSFKTRFRSIDKLKLFIEENSIKDSKNLLIQIASPQNRKNKSKEILKLLNSRFSDAKIIGLSSSVSIYESKITHEDIIISFIIFQKADLKVATVDEKDFKIDSIKKNLVSIIDKDTKGLILFSTFNIDTQILLDALNEKKEDIKIVGLMASDDLNFRDSFILSNDKIIENGAIFLSIGGDIELESFCKSDWEGISKEFIVTKANKNRLISLDNQAALDIYQHYIGTDIKNYPKLSLEFPLIVKRDEQDMTLQMIESKDDGSIILNSEIKKGDRVRLSFCNINRSLEFDFKIEEGFEEIFIFSSIARERFISKLHSYELNSFKDLDIAFGAYGYGEFFKDKNGVKLYNQSFCGVLLKESNKTRTTKNSHVRLDKDEVLSSYETLNILTNIAKSSSNELEDLNKKLKVKISDSIKEIRKKESLMIHNSRLAQLGEMLALIAHQWRQPLSAISATTTGMQIKLEIDSADKKYLLESLEHIEEYVLHLSQTIDDFTNFFKPNKKKESIFVEDIIKKSLFISSSLLSKNSIEVVQKYNKDDKLYTYPNELIQVILNLIKNSVKILVKREIKDPTIFIKEYKVDNKIVIEIGDNGGGVNSNIIDKIFEPYFSSNSDKESMGLGLYMSKFIIEESCKGSLDVANKDDGAIFKITLDSLNN